MRISFPYFGGIPNCNALSPVKQNGALSIFSVNINIILSIKFMKSLQVCVCVCSIYIDIY